MDLQIKNSMKNRCSIYFYIALNLVLVLFACANEFTNLAQREEEPPQKGIIQDKNMDLGLACMKSQNWVGAITAFNSAIQQNSNDKSAYEYRGDCYFAIGDLNKAIADYNKSIEIDPSNATVLYDRATAYLGVNKIEEALVDINISLRLNATNVLAHERRASIYSLQGQHRLAIKDWDEELKIYPNNARARAGRGWDYFKTGQYEKSTQDYNYAIQLNATNYMAYNNLAWILATAPDIKARNGQEAVKIANKACELSHWLKPMCLDTLAAAYAEMGDFDKAVQFQKQAMDLQGLKTDQQPEEQKKLELYQQHKPFRDNSN